MKRRDFIRKTLTTSCGFVSSFAFPLNCSAGQSSPLSRIVISREPSKQRINSKLIIRLLDNGLQALFDTDTPQAALNKIIRPGETVGLKVNCLSGRGTTNIDLVNTLIERLKESGIDAGKIIVWDRFSSDLEDGGFRISTNTNDVQYLGNDILGFGNDFEMFGNAASLVCKTLTQKCDVVINLPVLKDHGIAGMTCAMKNFFGAIHNPNKYHINTGNPYIADVYKLPSISGKVRLHICDALIAQFEGGPSYMPNWRWPYNGLILGTDPVAIDQTGWQIIEKKRSEEGLPSLREAGREPVYIKTAADNVHQLGTNKKERIRIIRV
jgi:uncharacterized protein (DUF362 family)